MGALENDALLRKGYEAMAAGDLAAVVGMFSPDAVLHVTGPGRFHGDHRGHDEIVATFIGLFEWTGGTLRLEPQDVFADDDHGVVTVRETATRASDGATLDVRESHLFRIDASSGLVRDFWDIPATSDREAHDAFFA